MSEVIKGADGAFYAPSGDGEFVQVQIPNGVEMVELPSGGWLPRPGKLAEASPQEVAEYANSSDHYSHKEFFANKKQKARRVKSLEEAAKAISERVDPGAHAGVRKVKDERYLELSQAYMKAVAAGDAANHPFQPLATYEHKIRRMRPILKGEIGVYGMDILVLEEGFGTGNFVQVTKDLANAEGLPEGRGKQVESGGSAGEGDEVQEEGPTDH